MDYSHIAFPSPILVASPMQTPDKELANILFGVQKETCS
jgi:hypothetical protein